MFHKMISVSPLPDYIIQAEFADGTFKQLDLKPYINRLTPFAALRNNPGLYEQADIDAAGYGVVWNDRLDLSAECIYENGIPCTPQV